MIDAAGLEVKQQYLKYSMMAITRGHCKDPINICCMASFLTVCHYTIIQSA